MDYLRGRRELLAVIRADERLRSIPVVAFTTAHAEEDILKSCDVNANCFITKPVALDNFIRAVKSVESFWPTVVTFPPTRSP